MVMPKQADQYGVGEEFEPLKFRVVPAFNSQYAEAVEDYHQRYNTGTDDKPPIVHPALLVFQSNVTRSPSFYLPPGMAAVHAKEEIEFLNPATVGKVFTVRWKVVDVYEKRGRRYQVKDTTVVDEDGIQILWRKITDTFIVGSSNNMEITADTPVGCVFIGKSKLLTDERVNDFSGGYPKLDDWPRRNIHTNLEFAQSCGLGKCMVSGAMYEGYIAELMIDLFGEDWLSYGKMNLAFVRQVFHGDKLTPVAVVQSKETEQDSVKFVMEVSCRNQQGDNVVAGTAVGVLPL